MIPPPRKPKHEEPMSAHAKALWRLGRMAVPHTREDAFARDMDTTLTWLRAQSDGTRSRFQALVDRVSLEAIREGRDPATAVVLAVLNVAKAIGL